MKERKELMKKLKETNGIIDGLEKKIMDSKDDEERKLAGEELENQNKTFDALKKKIEEVDRKIARENMVKDLSTTKGVADEVTEVEVPDSQHNKNNAQIRMDQVSKAYMIEGPIALVDAARRYGDNIVDAVKKDDNQGDAGVRLPSYIRDHVLENTYTKSSYPVLTSDASGSQSGGGSLVPDSFIPELYKLPQITDRLMDECYRKNAIGGKAQFPKLNQATNRWGVAANWDNEGASIAADNPVFSLEEIGTHRLTCLTQVSEKELRVNAVGLEAELAMMFRGAVNDKVSRAILFGTGSGQPTGINTNASIANGVAVANREAANQISYTDLNNTQYAVTEGAMDTGIWVISSGPNGGMKYISGLDDTYGRPVLREFYKDGLGTVPQLLGSRYQVTPNNTQNLGNRGDVTFGSFRHYALPVDKDISIDRSEHFAFDKGVVSFRVIVYIGGKPLGFSCFAVLGDPSAASSSSSSSSST